MKETIIIVAIAKNHAIGKDNKIPWHISEDFKRFKRLTKGHPVIMGKNTYFSLPIKPLPERTNIVVCFKDDSWEEEDITIKNSLKEAIDYAHTLDDIVYIIGGASIYRQAMEQELANKLEITQLDKEYDGDTFFPEINTNTWTIVNEEKKEGYSFITYLRK
ncbi:MAG TPA: dihydrofolate reductase [archaeon]|jgi:dihydrofolate reductase|nr:dihydrofolate reductase [archaeon]